MTTVLMVVVFVAAGVVFTGCKLGASKLAGGAFIAAAVAGGVLVLKHGAWPLIPPALTWAVLVFAWWAFIPRRELPGNRVRYTRARLRLRLHPGRGHATVYALWRHWGRFAAFRGSKRSRHSLSTRQRIAAGSLAYSIFLGRGHYRHAMRIPLEEHVLLIGPPRGGKTGWLARVIIHYPGSVLSTTTRPDVYALTSGLRARDGRPIAVFNPQGIGGDTALSTFHWSPIDGCKDPRTAIRRADAFANAIEVKEGDNKWFQNAARSYLRGIFHAAALADGDMRLVARWALTGTKGGAIEAENILTANGAEPWAEELAQLRAPNEKTQATNEQTMTQMLGFLADPDLLKAVMPGDSPVDFPALLRDAGTLYLIAEGNGDEQSPVAPLFAAIANEMHHTAAAIGQASGGGRMDPPLLMALDEITQVCPVPLPSWAADSGGKGIQLIPVVHGEAQLQTRWKKEGAQTVLNCCGVKVLLPGLTDTDTLEMASKLSGKAAYIEKGEDRHSRHEVMSPDMIRQLPDLFALVIRGSLAPVVARLPMVWKDREYKKALRGGWAVYKPPALTAATVPLPDVAPASAPGGPVPVPAQVPELVPVPAGAADGGAPVSWPEWTPSDATPNGNGHSNGNGHGHG